MGILERIFSGNCRLCNLANYRTNKEDEIERPHQYVVTWYGEPVGIFSINDAMNGNGHSNGHSEKSNGNGVSWISLGTGLNRRLPQSRYAEMPATMYNLHPSESFLGKLLDQHTRAGYIGQSLKTLSNIRIHAFSGCFEDLDLNEIMPVPLDTLTGRIEDFKHTDGYFEGAYDGPVGMANEPRFDESCRDLLNEWVTHRFSGKERKIPLNLDEDGCLAPAEKGLSFSHIGKFPSIGGKESEPLLEYMGLELSKAVGLETANAALVDQGSNLPPMLAIERFDIPADEDMDSGPHYLLQDFYSINGYDPRRGKNMEYSITYDGIIRQWGKQVQDYPVPDVKENMRGILNRVLLAWVMNDPDLHSKNFSALFKFNPENKDIVEVGFSPTYDAVVNASAKRDGSQLFYDILEGERTNIGKIAMPEILRLIKKSDLIGDAETAIFADEEEAQDFVRDLASKAAFRAVEIMEELEPAFAGNDYEDIMRHDVQMGAAVVLERARSIGAETPDLDTNPIWKRNKKKGPKIRESLYDKGNFARLQFPVLDNHDDSGRYEHLKAEA